MGGACALKRSLNDTTSISRVYHALAYYHEHPEQMREVERRRDEAIKSAREKTTITPLDE